uniref:NAD(P)-binding protein n=1 Tax=Mycena chlorophos TaxID=658473 RepID=A0ABQ0L9F9_MYCCL|nr:predicted protein [Mycena chlorophos]
MERKGVALVTGAAKGIGRGIALRLAKDGFDVCVNDLPHSSEVLDSVVQDIQSTGRAGSAYLADVSVEEQVKKMVAHAVETHGALNVMVANAGILPSITLSEISVEQWDNLMAINARGPFLCYKYAAAQMILQGGGGRIIGACSTSGKRPASAAMGAYCVSKFAVRGLTQAAALEYGPHNITVNAYAPGPVDTDLFAAIGDAQAIREAISRSVPLQRIGVVEDVAKLVSFLVSDQARFITGQSICVNGGMYMD